MILQSLSTSRSGAPRRRRISLMHMVSLHRQRRRLARLDDAALEDIGLTREDARHEARRPLWDVPAHWIE